ncbi:MAG: PhzF family phenazine biosynthesis protein [Mogibacterium sp.]|nr:PhzF family phenazine biosynthesis protein [Mogibacterium sp.]
MRQYIVDVFTDKVFAGNPAAVCILDEWLDDETMRLIARENNLAETAFAVKENGRYHLRWFTAEGEVCLVGHSTLAAAYVLVDYFDPHATEIDFETAAGSLRVTRDKDLYTLKRPVLPMEPITVTADMIRMLGVIPKEAYKGRDYVFVLENEDVLRNCCPDYFLIKKTDGALVHITAQGEEYDCVTRSFPVSLSGIEDPVCGSGHLMIAPYWCGKLGKSELNAYQASSRGGSLHCRYDGESVWLSGHVKLYSIAVLNIQ